jgi:hypothetical protein
VGGGYEADEGNQRRGSIAISTWARIEARTYDEALQLMEKLARFPSAIVQEADHAWSIYVSADAPEVPTVIHGLGVDPNRVSVFDRPGDAAPFEDGEGAGSSGQRQGALSD